VSLADRAATGVHLTTVALSTVAAGVLTTALILGKEWLDLVAAILGCGSALLCWGVLVVLFRERAGRVAAERDLRVAAAKRAERTRIVREMHDVLGHRLSLLATYAGALESRPDVSAEQRAHAAAVLRAGAHQALEDLREVIGVLRPEATDHRDGGVARPQPTLADVPRLVEECRASGVPVVFEIQVPDPAAVPVGAGRTAYRIVQEGLTNARKHAVGQPVTVAVSGAAGSRLRIDIRNRLANGSIANGESGTGLIGLAERVHLAGGQVEHGVTPAGEFRLCAALPWPP
jgi:signal transduction histidine kinase